MVKLSNSYVYIQKIFLLLQYLQRAILSIYSVSKSMVEKKVSLTLQNPLFFIDIIWLGSNYMDPQQTVGYLGPFSTLSLYIRIVILRKSTLEVYSSSYLPYVFPTLLFILEKQQDIGPTYGHLARYQVQGLTPPRIYSYLQYLILLGLMQRVQDREMGYMILFV